MNKNIVLCCDGTSNDFTGQPTNVLKLFSCLRNTPEQLCHYAPGVGTVADPTTRTSWGRYWSRRIDMGIGHSVREAVCQLYRFLSMHYVPGDRIFLFGFSRGAYAIRSLAGMIRFLGLLRSEQIGLERHAWSLYAQEDHHLDRSQRFRSGNRFSRLYCLAERPQLHFLGAWDTVSSFGWLWNLRTLPFTAENSLVRHIRHAVARDERRAMFQPNLFRQHAKNESFQEIWFPGGHGDVGGGWPDEFSGLSRVTLEWMAAQAEAESLLLDRARLDEWLGNSQGNQALDLQVHEALRGPWWLIELLPRRQWNPRRERVAWTWPHLGRRRRPPEDALFWEDVAPTTHG